MAVREIFYKVVVIRIVPDVLCWVQQFLTTMEIAKIINITDCTITAE